MKKHITQLLSKLISDIFEFSDEYHLIPEKINNGEVAPIDLEQLKPFQTEISESIKSSNSFYNHFKKINIPITHDEINELIIKNISVENFLNSKKSVILKNMFDDLQFVYSTLSPLEKLNVPFSLYLVGGAVRDFILNRDELIKDLDIMISLDPSANWKVTNEYSENDGYIDLSKHISNSKLLSVGFTQNEIDFVEWNKNDTKLQMNKLIQLCFLKTNTIEQTYLKNRSEHVKFMQEKDYDFHQIERLSGVIKLNNNKTHYPIDLLITSLSKPSFVDKFDYAFCKASICFINPAVHKEFPERFEYLISRTICDDSFWATTKHKKLTIDLYNVYRSDVFKSAKRYFLFKEKYPDYELNAVSSFKSGDLKLDLFNKSVLKIKLESQVTQLTDSENKIKKNKI